MHLEEKTWGAIDRKAVKDSSLADFTSRTQESTFDSLLDRARCVVVNGGNWPTIVLGIRFYLPKIRQKPYSQLPTSRQGYMPAEHRVRLISQQPSSVCLFCTLCEMRDWDVFTQSVTLSLRPAALATYACALAVDSIYISIYNFTLRALNSHSLHSALTTHIRHKFVKLSINSAILTSSSLTCVDSQ